jgi:hypothetical protein
LPEPSAKDVERALQVTAEIYSRNLSAAAATMFARDLVRFTPAQILGALARCRLELKTFPSVADIAARIDDGRPGAEQAWSMIPKSEHDSVVWTEEMAEAFGVASQLIAANDLVAARMAFREVYTRLVEESRSRNRRVRWTPSFGFDPLGREGAVREALERGRISAEDARRMLPEPASSRAPRQVGAQEELRRIEAPVPEKS